MKRLLTILLFLSGLFASAQTQPTLPAGSQIFSSNLFLSPDSSVWTGKAGLYINLGTWKKVTEVLPVTWTPAQIDSAIISQIANIPPVDLSNYYTAPQVDSLLTYFATIDSVNSWLAGKVDKTTTINGYPLSGDVTLVASDVGALTKVLADTYYKDIAWLPDWDEVQDKPSVFPPDAHTHPISDVIGLLDSLGAKVNITTTINGQPLSADVVLTADDVGALTKALADTYYKSIDWFPSWSEVTDKPATFPPSAHTHPISEVVNLQDALDGKQATITGAASTITSADLTADRALVSNGAGKVAVSTVTSTELGYISGVTSGVQGQIDNKVDNSTTITNTGGINVGGSLASGNVSLGLNETYLNNRYLRKDRNDDNDGYTLSVGKLVGDTVNTSRLELPSLSTTTEEEYLVVDANGVVSKREIDQMTFNVANAGGSNQFSIGNTDQIRFAGSGDTDISFNALTNTITINSIPGAGGGGVVTSVFGRQGGIVAEAGDYSTTLVTEGTNLYFTDGRVRSVPLTGFSTSTSSITATDNVLQALGKAQGQINNRALASRELEVSGTAGRIIVSGGAQNLTQDREWIVDLVASGVSAGTYPKVTVDTYGRVTAGASLIESDIPALDISKVTGLETALNNRELIANKATNFTTLNNTLYPTTQAVADYVDANAPAAQTLSQPAIGQLAISGGNTINLNTVNMSGNQTGIAGNKTWTGTHTFSALSGTDNSIVGVNASGQLTRAGLYFPYSSSHGTSFDANTLNENGVRGNNLWTNTPDRYNSIGVLESKVYNNGWVSQTFSKLNNPSDRNNFHFRVKYGGSDWTDWVRMWHSGDFKQADIDNWNTAFGWGNHALAGYLTSADLPTIGDGTLTLETGTGLSGEASFSANQSGGAAFTVGIAATHKLPTTAEWGSKQDNLVSGTTIKTINGTSILGSGDIVTPNTTYSLMTAAELNTGTATTARTISAERLNTWLTNKALLLSGGTVTGQIKRDADAVAGDDLPRLSQVQALISGIDIPTNTSDLVNDGDGVLPFITSADLPVVEGGKSSNFTITSNTTINWNSDYAYDEDGNVSDETWASRYGNSVYVLRLYNDGGVWRDESNLVAFTFSGTNIQTVQFNSVIGESRISITGAGSGAPTGVFTNRGAWVSGTYNRGDYVTASSRGNPSATSLYFLVGNGPLSSSVSPTTDLSNWSEVPAAAGPGVATGGTAGQILSKVNSTNFNTQWIDLPATDWSDISDKPSTFTPSAHTHNASDINAGVLSDARIPSLNASKINAGTFGIARIPTGTTASTVAIGNDSRILNGQTAFGWGNHGTAGYAITGTAGGQVRSNTDLDARYSQVAVIGGTRNSVIVTNTTTENETPTNRNRGAWFDFKSNSVIGIAAPGTYSAVTTFVPWSDNSGNTGIAYRLASTNEKLFIQHWGGTAWGEFRQLYDSGNPPTYTVPAILTTNKTLSASDKNAYIRVTGTRTLTIPAGLSETDYPIGSTTNVRVSTGATVNFAGASGVTLDHPDGTGNVSVEGRKVVSIVRVATNAYDLIY